ncbi:hypothetical protein NXC24_PC01281 (plasmid) [Rhizobium sp. NXC24]|nr:hypothetical protein NXC24_PC01281 [Rhizobium sp. NXC24]
MFVALTFKPSWSRRGVPGTTLTLHIIRPTPVSAARRDNFVDPNKSIICHANLQVVLETFS